jgi:hypothetical protein
LKLLGNAIHIGIEVLHRLIEVGHRRVHLVGIGREAAKLGAGLRQHSSHLISRLQDDSQNVFHVIHVDVHLLV